MMKILVIHEHWRKVEEAKKSERIADGAEVKFTHFTCFGDVHSLSGAQFSAIVGLEHIKDQRDRMWLLSHLRHAAPAANSASVAPE